MRISVQTLIIEDLDMNTNDQRDWIRGEKEEMDSHLGPLIIQMVEQDHG